MAYHILLPIYFSFQLFLNMNLKFFHYFKYLIPHSLFLVSLIIFFIFTKTNFEKLLQSAISLFFHYFQKYNIFFYIIIYYFYLIHSIFQLSFPHQYLLITIFHFPHVNSSTVPLLILDFLNFLHLTYNHFHPFFAINLPNLLLFYLSLLLTSPFPFLIYK